MDVTWLRSDTLEVGVIAHGARIVAVRTPDREGRWGDIALGLADEDAYRRDRDYLGACVGRFANRIASGRFTLDGTEYRIPQNEPGAALHGGPEAFEHATWEKDESGAGSVTLHRLSPDGENGFPGALRVSVTYAVDGAELRIEHEAGTDAPTVVNLTNHTYWNLAGGGSVEDHEVSLTAWRFLPVDEHLIPSGSPVAVAGTPFDLRTPQRIGARLREGHPQLRAARGYDHTFVIDGPSGALRTAAFVVEPRSGRTLQLRTDQPGVQFYTGNMLDGTLVLRDGSAARQGDAFCLEPQSFPDSPNRPDFTSTVLRPGEVYRSRSILRFGTTG
ncbi:aldose epimerase family protein [Pseudonocardia alaniniphila]|uniref:Aldose 1-epimerase n=1 Tax=Pseudonocardia alaniniphila TaxID=75291 RepID=A0ABS9TV78_9PSEU|nr:aldose epimerase family protein [Pseudonocardia alaniniphila]MCH6172473.1 galactose mutarotase [Pseudonocardia alaniniphila]